MAAGGLGGIRFRIRWRGRPIHIAIDHQHVELLLGGEAGGTEDVVVNGKPVRLTSGRPVEVSREALMPNAATSTRTSGPEWAAPAES